MPFRFRAIAFACALAFSSAVQAQQAPAPEDGIDRTTAPIVSRDARTRVGVERVKLPGGEHMGLVGLTELVSLGGEWWAGPAVYGAATGQRGGLLVPGLEGAWSHPFNGWLALDAGVFAGGGGGGSAPVGGGLMLRPHVDLVLRLPGFYTGPTWSQVRFVNGSIDSHQFGWMLNIDSSFLYRPADRIVARARTDGRADGLGFDRLDATVTRAMPHRSTLTSGAPMTQAVGLVGIRGERTIDGPLWAGIETAGAASGGVAGYAEVLGTAGLRWPVFGDRLSLGVRAALGVGGGGAIDTGGGALEKAAIGATWRISDTLGLGVEAGVVHAVSGHYTAATTSASLNWTLEAPRSTGFTVWGAKDTGPVAEATRMEFSSGVERYRAARKDGTTRELEAVVLEMNRFITPHVYLSGQAHSAFAGGAGAYSVGLFGIGTQWPLSERVRIGAAAMAGAAGGGGVDTQGGALLQARGYADLALTDSLSLRLGAGKVKSVHGGVDAPVVDAALVFRFGIDRVR